MINDYQGKVGFLLVNSHLDPEETPQLMKEGYATWGLAVPYLSDKDQVAMDALGARRSPEVFVLKKLNRKYYVNYTGAVDDNAQVQNAVTSAYLKIAIDNLLTGKSNEQPSTRAIGCSIKKR